MYYEGFFEKIFEKERNLLMFNKQTKKEVCL